MPRLLLVDDHAVVRSGLKMLLSGHAEMEIVGEAATAAEALQMAGETHPEVILMDIGLPDKTGIEATREIKARYPEVKIVALTIHEDEEYFFQMLNAGAVVSDPFLQAAHDRVHDRTRGDALVAYLISLGQAQAEYTGKFYPAQ